MILAIETSASICSVGFYSETNIIAEYKSEAPMKHSELVGSFVEKGLKKINEEIHLVAVAIGPGSFTGLRIGLSYAQGFCFGRKVPIVGVSNHQILAAQKNENNETYTIIDAHRQELYLAKHKLNDTMEIEPLKIIGLDKIEEELPQDSQLIYLKETIPGEIENSLLDKNISCIKGEYKPSILAGLGNKMFMANGGDNPENLEPLYIRPFAGVK